MSTIFVFGSNLAGRHGAGSALHAKTYHRAKSGVGVGRTGNAYAIPTKNENLNALTLRRIRYYVDDFIMYAKHHPGLAFEVVAIGCGLAGYTPAQVAPLFKKAPANCKLPIEFTTVLENCP